MNVENRRDAEILGGGTIVGGTYENVTISGGGEVTGDLVCTALQINGAATLRGSVKAASVTVNGAGTFEGAVQSSGMSVNGDATLRKGLGVTRLVVRGSLRADSGVSARSVDLRGVLRAGPTLEVGDLTGEGAVLADSMKADTIDMRVYGTSEVGTLEATRIVLRAPGSFADLVAIFRANEFKAERIRASEAWLEHVVTSLVSAGNVTVGNGCRIGRVHYSGTFVKQGDAQVTEERKG